MSTRRELGIRVVALSVTAAATVALGACGAGNSASSLAATTDPPSAIGVAAANPVTVSPLPGTMDASPHTQISFLGGPGTRVLHVRVVGSRSGVHHGVLKPYSTGTGESFLPSHGFRAGEHVTVHATVVSGTGAPKRSARTTFTIVPEATVSRKEFPLKPGSSRDIQHFVSAPKLTPTTVSITTRAKPGASPGDLFFAPYQAKGTAGPMIAEQDGSLVWFDPLPAGVESTNFHVQQYEGKPVLTWWQGRILATGFGRGADRIYDSSYRPVALVRAGNGYHADLHEFRLTPEGTAWIDAFDPIHMNLTRAGGARYAIVNDGIVQEIDVKTGLVMWEWHALGHIPLSESHSPVPSSGSSPWDFAHVNSIDPGPLNQAGEASSPPSEVLLSARSTWTLYDVSIHTGAVRWRVGGNRSSFKLGRGTRTYWQHDAEWQPGGLISVFDNGSSPPKEKQSRGLLLQPDLAHHTVKLLKQFVNPHHTLLASSQGNVLNLSSPGSISGNWLMGYGGLPNFTEHSASGAVLLDGTLGKEIQDFRTYLSPWTGHPTSSPALAVQSTAGGKLTLAVSWNGATEVASWQVLAGASPASLTPVTSAPKSGFETSIPVAGPAPSYVAVQALNAASAVIGRSPTIKS